MAKDSTRNTSTLKQFDNWYRASPASFSFRAQDSAALKVYQQDARKKLRELLGLDRLEETSCPAEVEVLGHTTEELYTGEKLLVRVQKDMWVPAWMLIPKASPPHPAIMCLHGHGMSKDILIGRPLSSQEEERLKRLKGDYGRRFAEAGFAVFCPDARGFGERDDGRGCVHIGQNAQAIGHALGGLRMWDHLRCMDYLFSRPDIDRQCVGAAGLSMGCEHSMYLGALDERVAFAILSCCIRDLRDEVHDKCHCGCSYIPGLFRFFDWSDIVCLIAPRPVLVQQGLQDYVPMALVESAVAKIGKAYRVADAAGNIDTDFFNGEHEFNFTGALNWLRETLEKTGLLARRSTTTE